MMGRSEPWQPSPGVLKEMRIALMYDLTKQASAAIGAAMTAMRLARDAAIVLDDENRADLDAAIEALAEARNCAAGRPRR